MSPFRGGSEAGSADDGNGPPNGVLVAGGAFLIALRASNVAVSVVAVLLRIGTGVLNAVADRRPKQPQPCSDADMPVSNQIPSGWTKRDPHDHSFFVSPKPDRRGRIKGVRRER